MPEFISETIQKLPLPVIQKQKIRKAYHSVGRHINKIIGRHKNNGDITFRPLIDTNRWFGNEYALRCHADINEDLYAIIEHGLFFGNNTQKIPYEYEWDLGCILTYGDYRKDLINQVFPDYFCEAIGAPILYCENVEKYRKRIITDLQIEGKTLLFFPSHGLEDITANFDADSLADQLLTLAGRNNCKNIIISSFFVSQLEILCKTLKKKSAGIKVCTYSCGNRYDQEFLYRQRALISLSELTVSNKLGTHIGNCVGLKKPHVLIKQEISYDGNIEREFVKEKSSNWKDQFQIEEDLFENAFPFPSGQATLTEEQYKMCDYYWGFSKKKTPDEIREIYHLCHEHALEFTKQNKMKRRPWGTEII